LRRAPLAFFLAVALAVAARPASTPTRDIGPATAVVTIRHDLPLLLADRSK
jgi:hypothetical protein